MACPVHPANGLYCDAADVRPIGFIRAGSLASRCRLRLVGFVVGTKLLGADFRAFGPSAPTNCGRRESAENLTAISAY